MLDVTKAGNMTELDKIQTVASIMRTSMRNVL